MGSSIVQIYGRAVVAVPVNGIIATWSAGKYSIEQQVGYPNYPATNKSIFNGSGNNSTSAFSIAGNAIIRATSYPVYYNVGLSPAVIEERNYQPTPGVLNATGALTTALLLTGIVTSTTAAAVAATLDTGTVTDTCLSMAINDCFFWSVINTGGNTFTVTAASGHTLVGSGAVATVTSGRFMTRKTAANTFVTYRLS